MEPGNDKTWLKRERKKNVKTMKKENVDVVVNINRKHTGFVKTCRFHCG